MANFFSPQKSTPTTSVVADPYASVNQALTKTLTGQLTPQAPYSGQMVAPLDTQQNESLNKLNDFANSSLNNNQTFQSGKGAINQILNTTSDPSSSPYYQAIKAEANRNLGITNQSIANANAGAGRFYSGAQGYDTGMAGAASKNALDTTMGQLALNEQQLKANVLPIAQSYAGTEMNFPLAQTAALQSYGALPNQYQQALDTANYNEWNAANYTRPDTAAAIASAVPGISPQYAYDQYSPSPFADIFSGPLGQEIAAATGQIPGASPTGSVGGAGSSAGGTGAGTNNTGTAAQNLLGNNNAGMLQQLMSIFGGGGGGVSPTALAGLNAGVGNAVGGAGAASGAIDPNMMALMLSAAGGG